MPEVNDENEENETFSSGISEPSRSRHGNAYHYDDRFLESIKTSRFQLIRGIYFIVSSIWTVVMIVGGFIAWLVSWLLL